MTKSKDKQKKKHQEKTNKPATTYLLEGMLILSAVSAIGLFRHRLSAHMSVVKMIAPSTGPYHFIYIYCSQYLHNILLWLAQWFPSANAIGWAIILLTVLIKLISMFNDLIVLNMNIRSRQHQYSIQSQLNLVNQTMSLEAVSSQQAKQLQELKQRCLKQNKANIAKWPLIVNIGIYILIMTALYQTVSYSINDQGLSFFDINLANRVPMLNFVSSALYGVNSYFNWYFLDKEARKRTSIVTYVITPITTFMSGYFMPSVITLYWITSASFLICQKIITNKLITPYLNKRYKANFKPKIIITKDKVNAVLNKD